MPTSNKPKLILLLGNYCSSNRGDAAILEGLIISLRQQWPDAQFAMTSWFPQTAAHFHNIPSFLPIIRTHWRPPFTAIREAAKLLAITKGPIQVIDKVFSSQQETLNLYRSASLVISIGGGYLQAPYLGQLWGRMGEIALAHRFNVPVYIIGQSLGPFGQGLLKGFSKSVLDKCKYICPREEISQDRLQRLPVLAPIRAIPDTAFALDINDISDNGQDLLNAEGLSWTGKTPLISVSIRNWPYLSKDENHSFQSEIAQALDSISRQLGAQIIFISMCTNFGGYSTDDRYTAFEVWRRMERRSHAHILVKEYDPYQIAAILKCADLHVGMRLHSDILATIAGTPCIAIEYEQKTTGIMKQLKLLDYVILMSDLTHSKLEQKVLTAWQHQNEIKKIMRSQIMRLKKEISSCLNEIL